MISSSNEDSIIVNDTLTIATNNEAFQRLITYGGNTVLNLEYPLAYIHNDNNTINFISRFVAKGAADIPQLGTSTDKWTGSGSIGLDFYMDFATSNNSLRFFGNLNMNRVFGSDLFSQNLGIEDTIFNFGQLTLGIVIAQNVKLSFLVSTFSNVDVLRSSKVVVGSQILP